MVSWRVLVFSGSEDEVPLIIKPASRLPWQQRRDLLPVCPLLDSPEGCHRAALDSHLDEPAAGLLIASSGLVSCSSRVPMQYQLRSIFSETILSQMVESFSLSKQEIVIENHQVFDAYSLTRWRIILME